METTTKTMLAAEKKYTELPATSDAEKTAKKTALGVLEKAAEVYEETGLKASAGLATALAETLTDAVKKGKALGYAK